MFRANLDPATAAVARKAKEDAATADASGGGHDASLAELQRGVVGEHEVLRTQVGLVRRLTYTDYTASGRSLASIEDYVRHEVLPFYGNTHTVSSATARQTTFFRSEARQLIKNYYNCSHDDALIFTGNGATGAVSLLAKLVLKTKGFTLHSRVRMEDRFGSVSCAVCNVSFQNDKAFRAHISTVAHAAQERERQVRLATTGSRYTGCVFLLDPLAHHSSLLPFRELVADSPVFYEWRNLLLDPATGALSLCDLEKQLAWAEARKLRAVTILSAGSNVTGIQPDHTAVEALTERHEAVLCWDLAAVAGHRRFDFNGRCDFAFASPHKLLGGPGSCGLLLAKKRRLTNEVPCFAGGGIVHYVTPTAHHYIDNHEEREEAGTPNILACIRAGLTYRVHSFLDGQRAFLRELELYWRVFDGISAHPNVRILGDAQLRGRRDLTGAAPPSRSPLPILSFNIVYCRGGGAEGEGGDGSGGDRGEVYLHYNFVTVLLNELFGVQVRGGCACAGPYAQQLLGMSAGHIEEYNHVLNSTGLEVLRPGFVRTGTHFTMTDADADRIVTAVRYIADKGWRFLAAYRYQEESGEWEYRHHSFADSQRDRKWLSSLSLGKTYSEATHVGIGAGLTAEAVSAARAKTDADLVAEADALLDRMYTPEVGVTLNTVHDEQIPARLDAYVFFARPKDFLYTVRRAFGFDVTTLKGFATAQVSPACDGGRLSPFTVGIAPADKAPALADTVAAEVCGGDGGGGAEQEASVAASPPPQPPAAPAGGGGKKKKKHMLNGVCVSKTMRAPVGSAIQRWGMIKEGDRILVGLSGGKDSLSLLHVLLAIQRASPVKFELAAATVNPMTPEYDPTPLEPYMKSIGVPYTILSQPLIDLAKEKLDDQRRPSICAFCSRMKRGMLYRHMRAERHNVLALGQHLDDIVESFVMSLFRNGSLATMKACYEIAPDSGVEDGGEEGVEEEGGGGNGGGGSLRVIRPLALMREKTIAAFAKENALPIIADNCPACFEAPKERNRVKVLLSQQEAENPSLFSSVLKAISPLVSVAATDRPSGARGARGARLAEQAGVAAAPVAKRARTEAAATAAAAATAEDEDMEAEAALTPCGSGGGGGGAGACATGALRVLAEERLCE